MIENQSSPGMRDTIRAIYALPTWLLLVKVIQFVGPTNHSWRKERISLAEWHAMQTDVGRCFDVVFTCNAAVLLFIATRHFLGV